MYLPVVDSQGIQGSGDITCQDNDCPAALQEDYSEYYVYASSETTDHDVGIQKGYPDRTLHRTIFRFQILLDNPNSARPGVLWEEDLGCDQSYPVNIGCVMTEPQPWVDEYYNGFSSFLFAFDSDWGFDFNEQPIGSIEVLPISIFMAQNKQAPDYSQRMDQVVGTIEDGYCGALFLTRIDTDAWRISYRSWTSPNLDVYMHNDDYICELVGKKRTVCSFQRIDSEERDFTLKDFDIYFVRQ